MEWINEHAIFLSPLILLAGAAAYKALVAYGAKLAAAKFSQAIDKALDLGDDEWDKITLLVVEKLERDIPDGISAEHPKVKALAAEVCSGEGYFGLLRGQEKRVAEAIAAIAHSIDARAKAHGEKTKEEKKA